MNRLTSGLCLRKFVPISAFAAIIICFTGCGQKEAILQVSKGDHILLVGNNLCSRMMNYSHFETELQLRFPDSMLYIRNLCDGGNTPGFHPHSGRESPWAFPGAEQYQATGARGFEHMSQQGWLKDGSQGHFESPDEWITRHQADIILAFFGYNESFSGEAGLASYKAELDAFIKHTLKQRYNGESGPRLVLVSPIAFEDLSELHDLPNGQRENANLALYTEAMKQVAAANQVPLVDIFTPSKTWYSSGEALTIDGSQMNGPGYQKLAAFLVDRIFGGTTRQTEANRQLVAEAVKEKNWFWHNDFKIPNGVHVYGRRYNPYGPDNYPAELKKIREMTAVRDQAIWKAAKGEKMDLAAADRQTHQLPPVNTNYKPSRKNGNPEYLYGEDALEKFQLPPGYQIELFASEKEFEDLANPVQLSFDNRGRLWVAVTPTYPHYRPGDAKPNDKLIILEDTDGDGKADRQTTFAEGLHLPVGFEFSPEGVYVSQGTNLVLLSDTDGDDRADKKEIILSGFDDHDTHHVISAFCADPSGAIYMGEGVFLHSNVETSYGPVRATNGGFFRYNPQRNASKEPPRSPFPTPGESPLTIGDKTFLRKPPIRTSAGCCPVPSSRNMALLRINPLA